MVDATTRGGPFHPLLALGHSTLPVETLADALQQFGVQCLVDVRAFPRSRFNPQFNIDTFPAVLSPRGICYRHAPALGGRRGRQSLPFASPNDGWRVDAFRNFADYALLPPFGAALAGLIEEARTRRCAILCAEADYHQCHRRIIVDWLLAAGVPVSHRLRSGEIAPAALTEGAVITAAGEVHYPPQQAALLL